MQRQNAFQESLITQAWEEEFKLRIAQMLRLKQLDLKTSFNVFDRDGDRVIDYNDFEGMLLGTLALSLKKEEI